MFACGSKRLLKRSLKIYAGTSLEVQWLRLRASTARAVGSIPAGGTKIPRATRHSQKKKITRRSERSALKRKKIYAEGQEKSLETGVRFLGSLGCEYLPHQQRGSGGWCGLSSESHPEASSWTNHTSLCPEGFSFLFLWLGHRMGM